MVGMEISIQAADGTFEIPNNCIKNINDKKMRKCWYIENYIFFVSFVACIIL